MDNRDYAHILEDIASLLKIKGANRFRIRAFENAARTIETETASIEAAIDAGDLTQWSGIGDGIAAELTQIYERGSCDLYDALVDELDAGLLELMNIQGLGPKRIKKIHDALGIAEIDDLQAAAEAGDISALSGFGKKTEQTILDEIERLSEQAGRVPLPRARRIADSLCDQLRALDAVDRIEVAGSLRRGRETANELWGSEASVLVGDFLYSRAFQMMVAVDSMPVMAILADATNTISEGEVLQLLNCHDADTTEERYLDVIRYKTAKLFEASARLAAVITGHDAATEQAMGRYGMRLGTAFQLVDDVLDYSGASGEIGKNIGDDLAEGKPTLPLIHAMRRGTAEEAEAIRRSIEEGGLEHIDTVRAAIDSTDALAYTAQSAQDEAKHALAALDGIPESPFKEGLTALASFSVDRTY